MENNKILVEHISNNMKIDNIEITKNSRGYNYSLKMHTDFSNNEERDKFIKRLQETIKLIEGQIKILSGNN